VLLTSPVVLAVGFWLLSQLDVHSTLHETTRDMIVVGLGLGLGTSTFVLVVQNAVPRSMMGVATAGTQFFRTIGATIGVTVMGAMLTSNLHDELSERLSAAQLADVGGAASPGSLVAGGAASLPADVAAALRGALGAALEPVFALGVPLMVVALAATVFVERRELRRSVHEGPGEPGRALFDELGEEFLAEQPAGAAARSR